MKMKYTTNAEKVWRTISMKELNKICDRVGSKDKLKICQYIDRAILGNANE